MLDCGRVSLPTVTSRSAEAFVKHSQDYGLPIAGIAGDEGKAAVLDQVLNACAEASDPWRLKKCFLRNVRSKWIPFESVEREELLGLHAFSVLFLGM